MKHIAFGNSNTYPIAVLIKESSFNQQQLLSNYIEPLNQRGISSNDVVAITLAYDEHGKIPVSFAKEYLKELLPALSSIHTEYLYVCDSTYFKLLTKSTKADPHYGYVLPCAIAGYENMKVVLGINYQALIYNPGLKDKLILGLEALSNTYSGSHVVLGSNIIHSAYYPQTYHEIDHALRSLHQYPELTCDIETFSLLFHGAGIGTISFAWDKHNGIAFSCDAYAFNNVVGGEYLGRNSNFGIRDLLRNFFTTYTGKITWHNAPYDVKVLIYSLYMLLGMNDTKGLLEGLDVFTKDNNFDDTKIISYLATNSTAGNTLGLKDLAHEFAGNWAKSDIKDIRKIPLPELLEYNLIDALSTWYVKDKYTPIMIADQQEQIYQVIMLPSLRTIIQLELTGMPMNRDQVINVRNDLAAQREAHVDTINNSSVIKAMNFLLQNTLMQKANAKLKTKQHNLEHFKDSVFNPNSGPQLQQLLYDILKLPVIDYTDKKQPATGADTLEKLIHHTDKPEDKELLSAIINYGKTNKILTTFIPAFENAINKDGISSSPYVFLFGNFNLGGTVSGRLSSSSPNLQNLPSGSTFGKLIKSCFQAPPGWLYVGADFNSLEDYISALTTKDPNKLAVYEQGFDGHCLRAAYYFRDELLHVDVTDPVSVNSLKDTHPKLRQESKAPTFALTYQGTYITLMNNLGFSEEKAKAIEKNYHELYKVSDQYVQDKLIQASKDGYVTVAFGLRVRTPLLKQVLFNTKKMPFAAAAEGRTAGNALGQSYGLLNNRAANDFMKKVHNSPYREKVLPVALIHDAIYLLIIDEVEVVEWVNRELIKSMQWQELPEIKHDTVKLGAALDIYFPSWATPLTLPNNASREEIVSLCDTHKEKYNLPSGK